MNLTKKDKKAFFLGAGVFAALVLVWTSAAWLVPAEAFQGEVYRILYIHVPSASCAFLCASLLFGFSIASLVKKSPQAQFGLWARASAEIGLFFTVLTLATGSLWGKPTWGTWWTWDARLTTTFVLALLYGAYLLLESSMPAGILRQKVCAVMGVLIFADVPIIYKSVTWWRTLHQPPTLNFAGSVPMDGPILRTLIFSLVLCVASCLWFVWQRSANLRLRLLFEDQSFRQWRGV
ncbi:MAG: cytochrome c biogenesis protein CcsA [Deltaproteobacteria bacterium]|nr:cytochrome c biogenesis protein CcsA [Deltaproteobacteria bacterium]